MIREKRIGGVSGLGVLFAALAVVGLAVLALSAGKNLPGGGALVLGLAALSGLFMVNPNEARVLQLFGKYVGTVREPGLRWANPFYSKRRVSLRVRNFETQNRLKVNDMDGNPIEMSAVVVWHIVDTAQATFEVDDYEKFARTAAEAAIRKLAMSYPYDAHEEGQLSLRGSPTEISE